MGYYSEEAREQQEQYDDEYAYMSAARVIQEEEESYEYEIERMLDDAARAADMNAELR